MSEPVLTAKGTDTIRVAAVKMDQFDVGCLIVVDGKKPIGIVTERDVLRKATAKKVDIDKATVESIMSSNIQSVTAAASLIEIASIMKTRTLRRIAVVNKKGELIGIVTSKDLIDILCA